MERRWRFAASAMLVLAAACGDDDNTLGIDPVGPQAPSSPGPRGPNGTGPGRIGSGGSSSDVASVAIAPASLTLRVGDSVQVVAAALDENGQGVTGVTFIWASSDTRVVRVRDDATQSGVAVVTGVGVGTATISVTAGDISATALAAVLARR